MEKRQNILILVGLILVFLTTCTSKKSPNVDIEKSIKQMTLEEKARFVVGTSKSPANPPYPAPGTFVRPPQPDNVNTYIAKNKVQGSAGESFSIDRLGILPIVYADGPAGVRIDPIRTESVQTFYATAFPIATLLSSTWNTQITQQVGEAIGNEALEYGIDILLAPSINIQRNPLIGRNYEYYSEDPLLTGKMAAAYINGIQSNGVGTALKHFAANNQETFRNGIDVQVSERALREIYLKGFEIAIKEAQPWTVMSSYNKINGVYASENGWLLTKLLRQEWNFNGFVLTDWWGEHDPIAQMLAGNDLLMPGMEEQVQAIIKATENGTLPLDILDRNVRNILTTTVKTPTYKQYNYSNKPDLKQHAQIARETASEGMILLENKNMTLPFHSNVKKIAAFGVATYDTNIGGSGSGYVYKPYKISIDSGLRQAGYLLDTQLVKTYTEYIATQKRQMPSESFWYVPVAKEMSIEKAEIERLAKLSDIAVFTIGRNSGEGDDRCLAKGDYYLTDTETELLQNITSCFRKLGKRTVVILNIGGIIEMTEWKEWPDAVLLVWQPGQEAGYAITDILSGKTNPSGKLAITIPAKYTDIPSAKDFPQSDENPSTVRYSEDIFVGYRHYNTFNVKPLYEFGYGLSYTHFLYSDMSVSDVDKSGNFSVSVKITNTGCKAGKEIVQLYVSAPSGTLVKPKEELKAFAKTELLKAGTSEIMTFRLNTKDLASFYPEKNKWETDEGTYIIKLGASSRNIICCGKIQLHF